MSIGTSKQKTLVFFGAHPDDETFGVGGTLARYSAEGVRVYYVCATRGEVGFADTEHMKGYATPGDMRWGELKCAADVLGLAGIIHLGYRDSGMPGSEDNKHPNALAAAQVEQVVGRMVKAIRELKPEVVVTFDPIGGYRHPDHIAVHNAAARAFHSAGDPKQYPDAGPAFQPQKLYFSIFGRGWLKVMVKLLPLLGQDPHRFGRNKDIDLAGLVEVEFPVHAVVRLQGKAVRLRDKARACHASQLGGGPPRGGMVGVLNLLFGQRDLFMRAYPPVTGKRRESGLFEGVV